MENRELRKRSLWGQARGGGPSHSQGQTARSPLGLPVPVPPATPGDPRPSGNSCGRARDPGQARCFKVGER